MRFEDKFTVDAPVVRGLVASVEARLLQSATEKKIVGGLEEEVAGALFNPLEMKYVD